MYGTTTAPKVEKRSNGLLKPAYVQDCSRDETGTLSGNARNERIAAFPGKCTDE
jgi:hypothetical protein